MKRYNLLLASLLIVLLVASGAALLYIRALRRTARHAYYEQIANQETTEITVTIPEGYRREQIAALLHKKGVTAADDFLAATKNDEGRLFPDTYRFFPATPADEVRRRLTETFEDKTADQKVDEETLIVASIVEREARNDEERAGIAGVYWNRYRAGYALTADPTVQYGRDNNQLAEELTAAASKKERNLAIMRFAFWQPITRDDYDGIRSPYNTYSVAGLPPGPIANPGKASIEAALSPTPHQYYYFFHTQNEIVYSRTLSEHNANKARYL